jgi:hypothetical protein
VPAVVGVPLMEMPLEVLKINPGGREPETKEYV